MTASADPLPARLIARGLVKRYPGVRALDGVDFSLAAGEVRALLGKNGAGKSTLVKILSGALRPDEGQVEIDGEPVELAGPAAARAAGIAVVHQELSLVPELTVAENLLLGRWREAGAHGPLLRPAAMTDYAERRLEALGIAIDPRAKAGALSVAQQQTVEIARALSTGGRVLILDEPTSSLPAVEVDTLLELVRRLARGGLAVVYVSHRMDEIPRVADSVTVLRDGQHVGTRPISGVSTARIVDMMTGSAIHPHRPHTSRTTGPVVLSIRNLSTVDRVREVSFELRAGEVVGVAGLLGSGRTELLRCLSGLAVPTSGAIRLEGRPFTPRNPRQAIRAGLGLAPEDRKREGLALGMSVSANLVLACLPAVRSRGLLSRRREHALATASCARLAVKAPSQHTAVGTLSGGNQQKVVLGKLLNSGTRVLLLDEPTRGVDVEAKNQIYQLIHELAGDGSAVLMVSSELEELFEVCDRLLVLREGRVVAGLKVADTTLPAVLALAMGGEQ